MTVHFVSIGWEFSQNNLSRSPSINSELLGHLLELLTFLPRALSIEFLGDFLIGNMVLPKWTGIDDAAMVIDVARAAKETKIAETLAAYGVAAIFELDWYLTPGANLEGELFGQAFYVKVLLSLLLILLTCFALMGSCHTYFTYVFLTLRA